MAAFAAGSHTRQTQEHLGLRVFFTSFPVLGRCSATPEWGLESYDALHSIMTLLRALFKQQAGGRFCAGRVRCVLGDFTFRAKCEAVGGPRMARGGRC